MDKRPKTGSKRFAVIENISRILLADREPESTLQLALDYLIRESEVADVGVAWIHDRPTDRLIPQGASGFDLDALKHFAPDAGQGMIGRVFKTGKGETYAADEATSGAEDVTEMVFGTKIPRLGLPSSVACVPLSTGKRRHGVLTLLNLGERAGFTESDISFFQVIANVLTLLIEAAALRRDLEVRKVRDTDDGYKTEPISAVAHEMRTPLTSIKGYSTALLMEEATFTEATRREFLRIIDQECDVLGDLISDFLESSIVDAGKIKIDLQPVRLPRLAAEATDWLGHRSPKHRLVVDFPDGFPIVDADPDRIVEVLRQLLDNAAKYSPGGGLIVLRGRIMEGEVAVSVADEGMGIAPEDLNRLFDKFFRAKLDSRTQVIGTGLGLPISRAIIEAHGGRIWAESHLGRGSTFCFTLPLKGPSQNSVDSLVD